MSSQKDAVLPPIRTSSTIKEQVLEACKSINLNYSAVTTNLLSAWLEGKIQLQTELDPDFVANAKKALEMEETQSAFLKLAKHHKKKKTYKNTIKI
jgi:hypothetical protein